MYSVLNLNAVLILFVIGSNATLEWGDECLLESGLWGVCVEATKCQQAYRSIKLRVGKLPKLCEYKGKETTVCCDDGNITEIAGIRSIQACRKWDLYRPAPLNFAGGGESTSISEFPHMAALGYEVVEKNETYWGCGGSLISRKFVLTAAHCLYSIDFGPVKHVRLGDSNLRSTFDLSSPQDFLVSATHKHPLYKRPIKYHDIALLELDRDAVMSEYVQPACLNIHLNTLNSNLIATGWGLLSFHGKAADQLQKLYLNHVNNTDCRKSFEVNSRVLSEGIQERYQICAGYEGRDTCQGDSGGPLQSLTKLSTYYIHGVTSFGKACLLTNSPGVYTRVANYIDWIEPIVWPINK